MLVEKNYIQSQKNQRTQSITPQKIKIKFQYPLIITQETKNRF